MLILSLCALEPGLLEEGLKPEEDGGEAVALTSPFGPQKVTSCGPLASLPLLRQVSGRQAGACVPSSLGCCGIVTSTS